MAYYDWWLDPVGGAVQDVSNALFPDPSEGAQGYLNQIPSTITPYYQPYINAGMQALPTLQNQYNQLISDPNQVISSIGSGYTQSPGYQWQYDQAMAASNNAAAAGGMAGSPQHQQQSATLATNLANQDYYNYMNQALGLYNTGLEGESGINKMGYGASNELAQSLAQALMSQAKLSYAGQASQNRNTANMLGAGASGAESMWSAFGF